MPKAQVRALAREFDLPVAEKADSQDICFVPTGRYTGVIERLKPGALKPGDIVHVDGRRLGRHEGIVNYTIGQRKGLKIPGPEPLYVVRLDAARNEVVVGPRDCLRTQGLLLRNTNWLGDEPFAQAACDGLRIFARIRSSQPPQPATLIRRGGRNGHCCARRRRGWGRGGSGLRVLRQRRQRRPASGRRLHRPDDRQAGRRREGA